MPDIDIDFQTRFDPRQIIADAIPASRVHNDELVKHPCGFYFQNIPLDPITKLAAIPYKQAEELGYFKIDFLHLSILDNMKSKQEIRHLIDQPPNWKLLRDDRVVTQLFQLGNQVDVVKQIQPTSVEQLADCIAIIRPPKRYLLDRYLTCSTPDQLRHVRSELYSPPTHGGKGWFKKSHAISYALTVVLQLHAIGDTDLQF